MNSDSHLLYCTNCGQEPDFLVSLKPVFFSTRYYHFSVPGRDGALRLCFVAEVLPFDEIAAYQSDPGHVTKLMSRSGGLGVVITAGTHGCGGF